MLNILQVLNMNQALCKKGESNLHQNVGKFQNIMSMVVACKTN